MNRKFSALLIVVAATCSVANTPDIQARILKFGIFKVAGKEEIVSTPDTPSGISRIPAGSIVLTVLTNRIPAKIGVRFGMWYEISNLPVPDGQVELVKLATHPPITKPDGTISKSFNSLEKQWVKGGRIVSWTGYGFDHDYELVTSRWLFEMTFEGRVLSSQEFTVFKE